MRLTVLAVVAMVARFTFTLAIGWITLGLVFTAACLTAVKTMSSLRTAYKKKTVFKIHAPEFREYLIQNNNLSILINKANLSNNVAY